MQTLKVRCDINVFGVRVTAFPQGIKEAFDNLAEKLPAADKRRYYGISECKKDGIVYRAAAEEMFEGEGEKYGYESYRIEKGDYLASSITGWQQKTGSIRNVFEELTSDNRFIPVRPLVEVYKSTEEMVCMVSICNPEDILKELEDVQESLTQVLSSFDSYQLNTVPFKGSWTAAQVGEHIAKSVKSIKQAFTLKPKELLRNPAERTRELKEVFLNLNTKFTSPGFITPSEKTYEKDLLIKKLREIFEQLIETGKTANLAAVVEHPVLGEITKFEMLHFVVYHTQRHIYQLEKMAAKPSAK